jgi:hypothetical protein
MFLFTCPKSRRKFGILTFAAFVCGTALAPSCCVNTTNLRTNHPRTTITHQRPASAPKDCAFLVLQQKKPLHHPRLPLRSLRLPSATAIAPCSYSSPWCPGPCPNRLPKAFLPPVIQRSSTCSPASCTSPKTFQSQTLLFMLPR